MSPHSRKSLADLCGDELGGEIWQSFTPHHTPTHGSWLSQSEIEIGLFSWQCLGRRRIQGLRTLRRQAAAWNRRTNRNRVKINWTFDRKVARPGRPVSGLAGLRFGGGQSDPQHNTPKGHF